MQNTIKEGATVDIYWFFLKGHRYEKTTWETAVEK